MRNGLIYFLIFLVAGFLIFQLFQSPGKPTEINLDKAITMSQNGEIASIALKGEDLLITTSDGAKLKTSIGVLNLVDLKQLGLKLDGVDYKVEPSGFDWSGLLISVLLPVLFFGFIIYFIFRSARGLTPRRLASVGAGLGSSRRARQR